MCKYCEFKEPIISVINQFQDRTESIVAWIACDRIKISTLIDTNNAIIPPAVAEFKIRLCPMCGRELKVD